MKSLLFALIVILFQPYTAFSQLSTSPDTYQTEKGELTIYPVNHGSVVFVLEGITVFVDPWGGGELYERFGDPDIIFITDIHGDHYSTQTLEGINTTNTRFVVPPAVADQMGELYQNHRLVIRNNEESEVLGIPIRTIPMYNMPGDDSVRHVKGRGNGYIIDFGGITTYISGDTEDIPEMRTLEGIDIAFVCMNLPFTMDINQASDAVIEFQPSIVYPYHHRGQDIEEFKRLVDAAGVDVQVILKDWYSN
jgi:L-ascorbate metabolism protein UlaG (beta-lactamase superfamily)